VNTAGEDEVILALRLLGDLRYTKGSRRAAAAAIEPALHSRQHRVAVEAMRALARSAPQDIFFDKIGPFLRHKDPRLHRAAIQCLASARSPETIAVLQRLYSAADRGTRQVILGVLEDIGDDSVLPFLVDALSDDSLPIRNSALEVVIKLGRERRIDPTQMLLWLLRSANVHVRRQAVDIVLQVGDPLGELWPKLLRLLRDEDWWVRERVVDALVELAGEALTRHVVGYLEDDSDVVRRYAVEVLLRLKDPRSLGALLQVATRDTDWWVRERAVECLGAIGDPKIVPHLSRLGEDDPTLYPAIVAALHALRSTKGLPILLRLFAHAEGDLRLEALRVAAELGEGRITSHVRPLLSDEDPRVRNEAKRLMLGWEAGVGDADEAELEQRLQGFERLLWWATKEGGDDLFLIADQPPFIKKLGAMVPLTQKTVSGEQVESTLRGLMTQVQQEQFDRLEDVDFSLGVKPLGLRFRVNVLRQVSGVSAVFRKIVQDVRPLSDLGLPPLLATLCDLPDGLVLLGGPTGSGKSTTLAAMIHHINQRHGKHIITIEDPIEVVHEHDRSVITQREVGSHTRSFANALRATLREDPDVILVGEMRDLETIQFALSAAETGHLVFATVHTVSADTSVDRLIDAFPPGHQVQIRAMLSQTLRAVVCQHLLRTRDGGRRVPAVEILLNTDAAANLIRKGQCYQLPSIITTSRELGMQSMDDELRKLVLRGQVSAPEAYAKALDKSLFEDLLADEAVSEPPAAAPRARGKAAPPWVGTEPGV
jgi:twitching motility protein PilT